MPEEDKFVKTPKQKEAIKLLASSAKNIMALGGSRSGKTFILIYALIVRACKVKSRHVILREKFNAIKTSIWLDTLPKVMKICFPDLSYHENKTDYYITLPNGSEIWIGGLDNKERTEKILGKEYSTIYFNECSQLQYHAVIMAKTRLAEKNILKKKFYFDENPPTKRHWSYWLFVKYFDPVSEMPVNKKDYVSILMNPKDNLDNIDEDYLSILEAMPEKERIRFMEGIFNECNDGEAYYEFDRDRHVKPVKRMPGTVLLGMDFNVNPMTSVQCSIVNGNFHIFDEVYQENSDTPKMCFELRKRKYTGNVYPDSTGKNRKTSGITDFQTLKDNGFSIKGVTNPFVNDRVNNINRLLKADRIIIDPKCKKLINDLEKVSWKDNQLDQKGENKMLTHISDALGYLCWAIDNGLDSGLGEVQLYQRRGR